MQPRATECLHHGCLVLWLPFPIRLTQRVFMSDASLSTVICHPRSLAIFPGGVWSTVQHSTEQGHSAWWRKCKFLHINSITGCLLIASAKLDVESVTHIGPVFILCPPQMSVQHTHSQTITNRREHLKKKWCSLMFSVIDFFLAFLAVVLACKHLGSCLIACQQSSHNYSQWHHLQCQILSVAVSFDSRIALFQQWRMGGNVSSSTSLWRVWILSVLGRQRL